VDCGLGICAETLETGSGRTAKSDILISQYLISPHQGGYNNIILYPP